MVRRKGHTGIAQREEACHSALARAKRRFQLESRAFRFSDPPAESEQCRQEAMHAFEKFEARNALALKSAIGAHGIADLLTRQFVPDPLGDARGGDAYEAVAFAAVGADAVFVRFFPGCKRRLEGFGFDGEWFAHVAGPNGLLA